MMKKTHLSKAEQLRRSLIPLAEKLYLSLCKDLPVNICSSTDHPGYILIHDSPYRGGKVFSLYLHPSECYSLDAVKLRIQLGDNPQGTKEAWEKRTYRNRRRS